MIFYLFLFITLTLFPTSASAQGTILTLEEAINEVLATNPDIQASRYRVEAAKARIPQAKSLDDPMIGVMFEDVPIDTIDVTEGEEINYRVEQKIPFPGKRSTRGKAARFDADAAFESSQGRIQDVLLDLKRTYYTVYQIDRSLEVNRGNQSLLKQFLGSMESAYASGKSTADAPLKAQVEWSKLKNEEILLQQERRTHQAHLQAILNRPNHETIRLPSKLSTPHLKVSRDEILGEALQIRPELKSLDAMKKRDQAKVTSAKHTYLPDFSFAFEYNQVPNALDHWTGAAMINFPFLYLGKKRAEVREAKSSLKATEFEQESAKVHTRHDIEQAYSAVKAAEQLISSYQREILPQSKTTLESAQTSYASGKLDFLTLIDAARTYKDLQMSYYENQARHGIAFAELERLVGRSL